MEFHREHTKSDKIITISNISLYILSLYLLYTVQGVSKLLPYYSSNYKIVEKKQILSFIWIYIYHPIRCKF